MGKSNILTGIQLFFDFFKSSDLVATATPPVTDRTNWRDRDSHWPIRITANLALEDSEMNDILTAIANETPQMKNALERVSQITVIECQIAVYRTPQPMAYISHMSFGEQSNDPADVIFSMTEEAAKEVSARDAAIRALKKQQKEIERASQVTDDYEWATLKERATRPEFRYIISRSAISEETNGIVAKMIRASESSDDFQSHISSHTQEMQDKLADLLAKENVIKFQTFSGESAVVPGYISAIMGLIKRFKVHHLAEHRDPIGPEEAERILRLKNSRGQGQVFKALQNTVAELLGVQIDAVWSEASEAATRRAVARGLVPAELDVDDFLVQANGTGIRESLRLILDFEFERPDLLLLEEPEVHLHPALEITVMQYLRKISAGCQVFLTTHSTNFLDIADPRNVYLITKDQATHAQLLNVEEAEEAIPQELGIRLSSLFMYDRLVFVEGESDEQVLRTFAATLGLNLSRTAVGFIAILGARNFTHYANGDTLTFLSRRRVKVHFILDHDERDAPEIEKLRTRLGGRGELKVLDRRELENYLLSPDALARYLSDRTGKVVDPAGVAATLAEAAESLLKISAERRVLRQTCIPVIPDRNPVINRGDADFITSLQGQITVSEQALSQLKERIPELLEKAHSQLKGITEEQRLEILPGEELLAALFEKHALRFSKRKDVPKIAALMTEEEIPSEIADLLRKFTVPA